jgi:ribosomal protein L11 methyltransferase
MSPARGAKPTAKPWTHVSLRAPDDAVDALVALFVELGAPGAITGQRDLRRRTHSISPSPTARVEAYFPPDIAPRLLSKALRSGLAPLRASHPRLRPDALRFAPFEVPDYSQSWRTHFPAISVGRRLRICPPWADAAGPAHARPDGRIALRIHPGQAFGTGHHPTTRGCLVAIERACAARALRRGLDVGCGSGILALAMRRLGVRQVVAVDNDPLARTATAQAARENRIDGIRIASDLSAARGRFDLIAANLFANLLVELAPALASRLSEEGSLIVSGLLSSQEGAVRRALAASGLRVAARQSRSTWVTLSLNRKRAPRPRAGSHP